MDLDDQLWHPLEELLLEHGEELVLDEHDDDYHLDL